MISEDNLKEAETLALCMFSSKSPNLDAFKHLKCMIAQALQAKDDKIQHLQNIIDNDAVLLEANKQIINEEIMERERAVKEAREMALDEAIEAIQEDNFYGSFIRLNYTDFQEAIRALKEKKEC